MTTIQVTDTSLATVALVVRNRDGGVEVVFADYTKFHIGQRGCYQLTVAVQ